MNTIISRLLLIFLSLCLSACITNGKPDLKRLYAREVQNTSQPPIVIIHGLMGSTLVDKTTGKEFYPKSASAVALSEYQDLAISPVSTAGDNLVPGAILNEIAGINFYSALTKVLEDDGLFVSSTPGQPVGTQNRRYYTFIYDWRRDNIIAVKQLHAFIDQIRQDYNDPNLRVDIIAHSNGGLLTNYYLRYGPNDVLDQKEFKQWQESTKRVRRVVLLGTPNLGSVTSLERLIRGFRLGLRLIPVEVLTSFATPFEALPSPITQTVLDTHGNPTNINIFDPALWEKNQWSVFSPEFAKTIEKQSETPEQAKAKVAILQKTFSDHLLRAERFQASLTTPFQADGIRMAAFGGDCELTPNRVILDEVDGKPFLALRAKDIVNKVPGVDYEYLMMAPGDGLVTRDSQDASQYSFLPLRQSFFLCEQHEFLVNNTYFQNNLLYFLLAR
ncbi:MAG: esterase/lipase family protein [Arenimonas sp.]